MANRIPINAGERDVSAFRNADGIPVVQAKTLDDAFFGLGTVHAMDRGTQMLFSASVARGRGAEEIVNSEELFETDCFFRRLGLHRRCGEDVQQLPDDWQRTIGAYCDGVNAGLQSLGRTWPMWATDFQPRGWDAESVILIGKLLSFGGLAVSQLQSERLLIELIHAGVDDEALKELFKPRLDQADFDAIRRVRLSNQLSDEALELITDLPRLAGSNAWAVMPSRTEMGAALLAADPHLEVNRLPAIWHEVILQWGEDEFVMGATLPGCPLFAVARTRALAWGVTYMKGDTVDFFIEDCRQVDGSWQYRRDDSWLNFNERRESIERKGEEPSELLVLENDQGILDQTPDKSGTYLSVNWAGNHGGFGGSLGAWLEMVRTPDAETAMSVAKLCRQPTLCWVFADRKGHIGMQGCGRFPQRQDGDYGLVPVPAWNPENHWQGWLDDSYLPSEYDPKCGFIATANEEQNQTDHPWLVSQPAGDYRKVRIDALLHALPAATVADMQRIQYDVYSVHADRILRVILPYLDDGELKSQLNSWDRCFDPASTGASLFMRLYLQVMVQVMGAAKKGIGWRRMVYLCSRSGYSLMVLTAADRLLERESSIWWTYRDKSEVIQRAAKKVSLEPIPWSAVNNFHFTDRFFGGHRVGRLLGYDTKSYPMPGCHATPFQGHVLQTATREATFAPSYHFVSSFHENGIWSNLPGGASENRFSKFYRNDLTRWLEGTYKWVEPLSTTDEPTDADP